jgi:hypothetical protein
MFCTIKKWSSLQQKKIYSQIFIGPAPGAYLDKIYSVFFKRYTVFVVMEYIYFYERV